MYDIRSDIISQCLDELLSSCICLNNNIKNESIVAQLTEAIACRREAGGLGVIPNG